MPILYGVEQVEADIDSQEQVQGDEHSEAKEVLETRARLGRNSMVFKEKSPDRIPPTSESQHLVLAGSTRLLEGKLKAFDCIARNVVSTLRFVNDLDRGLFASTSVDEDIR